MTFEEIYNNYNLHVYNLALHYVQNTSDAEEITQDVFVAIHQSLHTFEQRAALSTWIYRIAVNKSLDLLRSRKRKKYLSFVTSFFYQRGNDPRHDVSHNDHPGMVLEQKEALITIFELIGQLPDNQKTALILSKIEHKSQREIADIMNLSPKAVESLIQRAKTNLTKKLGSAKEAD